MMDPAQALRACVTICFIQIATSLLLQTIPDADIIVNIDKAYALRRIGAYSPKLDRQIVHSFVTLNDICVAASSADICTYASGPSKTNILELTTTLAHSSTLSMFPNADKDSLSRLIGQNLTETLAHHNPERHLREFQVMAHLVDDRFIQGTRDETSLPLSAPSTGATLQQQQDRRIPRFSQTASAEILSQLRNQKIGFNFIPDDQIKAFLTAIFLTIDKSYVVSDVRESLEVFQQLVVAQSIFALRHCSSNQSRSSSQQACLVVSTMFLRVPPSSSSTYSVYELILLPIAMNSNKYLYSNMPKIVGVNTNQLTTIAWNSPSDTETCLFSLVVQCVKAPLVIPLANTPCLRELLNDGMMGDKECHVIQSPDTQAGITEIDTGIWLFYNVHGTQFCQAYSMSDSSVEMITVSDGTLLQVPCDKTVMCFGTQLPPSTCVKRRLAVLPQFPNQVQQQRTFQISMANTKNRLLSAYKAQRMRLYLDMNKEFRDSRSFPTRMMEDFGYTILSIMCTILFSVLMYVLRCMRKKLQSEVENLQEVVHDMLLE
jgi:hypothetical protein